MRKLDYDLITKYYEYFYRKRYNSPKYKFKPSEKTQKTIETFLKLVDKYLNLNMVGEEFLWGYFVYQFNYWRNAEITAFHGKFRIEYVIGKKAFLRYIDEKRDDHWVIQHSEIIELYDFRKKDLIESKLPVLISDSDRYEQSIKRKYLNTSKGFYMCVTHTTLYNHQHTTCLLCQNKIDCKKLLKDKFNEIYRRRGY